MSPPTGCGPGTLLRVTFGEPDSGSEMTLRCTVGVRSVEADGAARYEGEWLTVDGPELGTDDLISAARRLSA